MALSIVVLFSPKRFFSRRFVRHIDGREACGESALFRGGTVVLWKRRPLFTPPVLTPTWRYLAHTRRFPKRKKPAMARVALEFLVSSPFCCALSAALAIVAEEFKLPYRQQTTWGDHLAFRQSARHSY
uniref:Lipoprotein n=1 Tax=Mesocestoides corti TaxID=53468 RepID=A0A5K3EXD9_MESCO